MNIFPFDIKLGRIGTLKFKVYIWLFIDEMDFCFDTDYNK